VDKVTAEKPIVTENTVTIKRMSTHLDQQTSADCAGFTLVELIVVVAIVMILALISIPAFTEYIAMTKNKRSIADLNTIDKAITAYVIDKNTLPPTGTCLNDVGMGNMKDPWNRNFVYINLGDAGAEPRQDRVFQPLNTDYDLYSTGIDGTSDKTFAGPGSTDDLVRVNNGSTYILRDEL